MKSLGPGVSHYVHRLLMSQVTLVSITGLCVQDSLCVMWLPHAAGLSSSGVRCATVAAMRFGGAKVECKGRLWAPVPQGFYPNIEHRLTLKISPTPNFTTIVTGHGKINSYLHRFKIIDNPVCPCNREDQTADHTIYRCVLHEQERNRLKSDINSSEK